jgi:hypothetical protein
VTVFQTLNGSSVEILSIILFFWIPQEENISSIISFSRLPQSLHLFASLGVSFGLIDLTIFGIFEDDFWKHFANGWPLWIFGKLLHVDSKETGGFTTIAAGNVITSIFWELWSESEGMLSTPLDRQCWENNSNLFASAGTDIMLGRGLIKGTILADMFTAFGGKSWTKFEVFNETVDLARRKLSVNALLCSLRWLETAI